MNRRNLLIRAGLVAAGLGGAWWVRDHVLWRDPNLAFGPDGSSGWLDYDEPRAATPTVRVRIAGRDVRALIDSGAQYSVIDAGLFRRLGLTRAFDLPLIAYGVGGGAQMGKGTTLELNVGAAAITGLRAAILSLGPLASDEGLATPLILGQDVLGQAVLELDTEGRRLRLLAADGHVLPADVAPLPVRRSRGALIVEVTVEGARVEAVVDTGASALLALGREAAENAGLLDDRDSRRGSSIVLGGAIASRLVSARTVTVGDQLYRDVQTAIYEDAPVPGFPTALLGMEAFAGRRLVMDLGGAALHVSRPLDLTVGPMRQGRT